MLPPGSILTRRLMMLLLLTGGCSPRGVVRPGRVGGGSRDDADDDDDLGSARARKPHPPVVVGLAAGDGLFLENKLDEGSIEIVSDFPVLLLLHDEFVFESVDFLLQLLNGTFSEFSASFSLL